MNLQVPAYRCLEVFQIMPARPCLLFRKLANKRIIG